MSTHGILITESEPRGEHDAPCNTIQGVQVIQVLLGGRRNMNEPSLVVTRPGVTVRPGHRHPEDVRRELSWSQRGDTLREGRGSKNWGHDPLFSDYCGARLSPHLIQTISSHSEHSEKKLPAFLRRRALHNLEDPSLDICVWADRDSDSW